MDTTVNHFTPLALRVRGNKNLLKQKCKKINKIIYNLWDNSSGNVYSMLAEMTNLIKIKAQIKNLIGLIRDCEIRLIRMNRRCCE